MESFSQSPPQLDNQYQQDRVLKAFLRHCLPADVLHEIQPRLDVMGRLVVEELYVRQLAEYRIEPTLTQWDPWGNRIDRIEVTPLWHMAARIAAEFGLVAAGYERRYGGWDRVHQFALVYLFAAYSDVYSCPLAMSDGAARALSDAGNTKLKARAVPHLISRDPDTVWTSGQWMTETPGGSDVSMTETIAGRDKNGNWSLRGRKWFTSAIDSQMALTLARPEGNPSGGRGLALFYVETRDAHGAPNSIQVLRLKDKLGTRKVPTAELYLDATPATLVGAIDNGVRQIAPVLNITRIWNAVTALSFMRRGIALARDYAARRRVFGAALSEKPAHVDTLAGLQAEFEAAFHLVFRVVELLGASEHDAVENNGDAVLMRVLTPVAKLLTGRQVVQITSEVVEAFGGAGYIEDTGIPALARDAQVLPIWEGTTNVLALDTFRAIQSVGGLDCLSTELARCRRAVTDTELQRCIDIAEIAFAAASAWFAEVASERSELEAGARRFALTLGRSIALALCARHAQWSLDSENDARPRAAAKRFALHGIDLIRDTVSQRESQALGNDWPVNG